MKNFSAMLASVLLMAGVTPSWAQEQPGGLLPVRDLADRIKKPADWFLWGADLRLRNDSAENPNLTEADPPGHTYSFERLRIREWNSFTPCKEFEFNLRFTWEGRHYWAPASKKQWDGSDIVFDNLNGKFTFQEIPATLIVGRQDMVFGDGWLISDGTPLDGPRTNYFDAVRATVELPPIKGALDLIYIDQTASPDSRLSPIFSKSKPLMEQNERGVIVYFSNSSIERTSINAYFIYKHDEAVLANGDSGEVYTIGSRLAHDVNNDLSGRIEGAYQFGTRRNAVMFPNQDGSLSAWGVVSRLTYSFHDPSKSQAWLGYQGLSGNDAHDTHNRQFDPLWGRWAQYSELFPNDLDRPGRQEQSPSHQPGVSGRAGHRDVAPGQLQRPLRLRQPLCRHPRLQRPWQFQGAPARRPVAVSVQPLLERLSPGRVLCPRQLLRKLRRPPRRPQ